MVSWTTRAPRPGEVDGVAYHFTDEATFRRKIEDHELLEWAGLGVAMANASSWTKSFADLETASNAEDGVALVVERLLAGEDLRPRPST